MKLSFNEICNIIDWTVSNEKNVDFYIKGSLLREILEYLECEHDMPECEDCEYEDIINDYKVYSLSLDVEDAFQYIFEEAYFNGILLENDGDYTFCCYIDKACEITQLDRIHGNKVLFDLDEESHECCDCNGCIFEGECEENELDEENYALNLLLDRIENLEDRVIELESAKSEEAHFFIDDIEVSKEIFDKAFGDFESKVKSIDRYLKW